MSDYIRDFLTITLIYRNLCNVSCHFWPAKIFWKKSYALFVHSGKEKKDHLSPVGIMTFGSQEAVLQYV